LVWLCHRIAEYDITLRPGQLILPRSCVAAAEMAPWRPLHRPFFEGRGEVSFDYTGAG
jgi:2-keto-4-pentenoate hydratase